MSAYDIWLTRKMRRESSPYRNTSEEAEKIRATPEYKAAMAALEQNELSMLLQNEQENAQRKAQRDAQIRQNTPQIGMGDSPAEFSNIPQSTAQLPSLDYGMGSPSTENPANYYAQTQAAANKQQKYNQEIEALQSQWDADPIAMRERWISPDYVLSDAEKQFARDRLKEMEDEIRANSVKMMGGRGTVYTGQDDTLYAQYAALSNKLNPGASAVSGIVSSVPGADFLMDSLDNYVKNNGGETAENTDWNSMRESVQAQNPLAYGAGYLGGKMAQYSMLTPFLSKLGFAQAAGNAIGGTKAAQALSQIPVLGHLATPEALSGIIGDTAADLALDTFPSFVSDLYKYDAQQVDDTIPESEKMAFSDVLQNAAGNVAGNVAFNAAGEVLPSLIDATKGLIRRANNASPTSSLPSLSPKDVQTVDNFVSASQRGAWEPTRAAELPSLQQTEAAVETATKSALNADEIVRAYTSGEQLSRAQMDTLKPNGSNRAAFEAATGIKLPDSSSATRAFFASDTLPSNAVTQQTANAAQQAAPLSSAARAQQVTGKPMQSSLSQRLRNLYDDIDNNAISPEDLDKRITEIAEKMVDRKSYIVDLEDPVISTQREFLKQKIYINDNDLSDLLSMSGAKNLTEFNRQFGTHLTQDDSAIPLDTWVMDLFEQTGDSPGFVPVDDFLETLSTAKSYVQKQFDEAGYTQAVKDAQMQIMNGYAAKSMPENGVGAMRSQFDRSVVQTKDAQNQAAVLRQIKHNRVQDLPSLGTQQHTVLSDAQARYDAKNILDAETLAAGNESFALRNIMYDLTNKDVWSKEDVKTAQLVRDKLIEQANKARKGTEEYHAAINELDEWIGRIANAGTKSGQSLQAYKEAVIAAAKKDGNTALALVQKRLDRLNKKGAEAFGKKWKDFILSDAEKDSLRFLTDENEIGKAVQAIERRIAKEFPSTMKEKVRELMRISMLANPRTMIRNAASNVPSLLFSKASNRIAGMGEAVYGAFKKDFERTQSAAIIHSAQSKNIANEVFQNLKPQLLDNSRWDDFLKSSNLDSIDKEVFKGGVLNPVIGDKSVLEHIRDFTYWLLEKGDNPFFEAAYKDRLASYIQVKGIKSAADVPEEALKAAFEEAMRATYKDNNAVTKVLLEMKKQLPFTMDLLMPFVKTPVNVAARAVEYSPFGFAQAAQAGLKGKGAAEVIDKLSKASLGSAGLFLGAVLYKNGWITGPESDDADEAAFMKSQGWLPFAINAGGNYYTFDWAQPGTTPLVLGATIADTLESGKELDIGEIANIVKTSAVNLGDSLLEMSPLQTFSDVFGGYGTPTENLIDAASDYPQRLIPSILGAAARGIDPVQRSTYSAGDPVGTFINEAQAKIPFLSERLPASYNAWGNEIRRADSTAGSLFSQFVNPGQLGNSDQTTIDNDIMSLYNSTGSESVFPRKVNRSVNVDGQKLELDNKQYSDWQRDAGQLSYSLAEQIVNSSLSDDQKADYLADAYSFAMAYTANDLFDADTSSTLKKQETIYESGGADLLANWYYLKAMSDGSPSQEETKAILDRMNISRAEKAILWEQTNSSWKYNPYK